jgi:hypothetical protein
MPLDPNIINAALDDAIVDLTRAKSRSTTVDSLRLISRATNLLTLVTTAVGGDVKATSGGTAVAEQTAKNAAERAGEGA